jgi:hypothetical protein
MRLPKLQLRLITCIVLMFVAGGLVWANLQPRLDDQYWFRVDFAYARDAYLFYGWPADAKYQVVLEDATWNIRNLIINVATALAILTATAVLCEYALRCRRKI